MTTKKRNAAGLLFSKMVGLRSKEFKKIDKLEQLTGKPIDEKLVWDCLDNCHGGKTKLNKAERAEMLAKIERGDFIKVRSRRSKGNGEARA